MTIPNLPSDSLYKFVAFFGMTLAIVVLILGLNEDKNLNERIDGYNASNLEIHIKDSLIWSEVKAIQEESEYYSKRNGIENPFFATDSSYKWTMTLRGSKEEMDLSDTIKQLLNRFNIKRQQLNDKKVEKRINNYLISKAERELKKNLFLFCALTFLSGIICSIGFSLWYEKVQHPNDKKTARELLLIPVIFQHCQSCYVNFNNYDNHRASEIDGTTNNYFCSNCYSKGQFTNPDQTLKEMKEIIQEDLNLRGYKEKKIKEYLRSINRLQRWNKKLKY